MPRCRVKTCSVKRAVFGLPNGEGGYCCKAHKTEDMRNVVSKRCEIEGCDKQPSYGIKDKKPTRCREHKTDDMRDVVNKRCEIEGCDKIPCFGLEDKKPTRCREHKTDEMQDVVSKRCEIEGCDKQPSYGIKDKEPTRCQDHKTEDMRNVKHKRCEIEGCDKRPSYGLDEGNPTRCVEHKTENMRDVVNKRCEIEGCDKQPSYGIKDKEPTRCQDHKTEDMRNVKHKRCEIEGCDKRPSYGLDEGNPTRCVEHKTDEMRDVVNKRCHICPNTISNIKNKYEGYCFRCFLYTFPDAQITRNYKVKEKHFADFLKDAYPNLTMTFDRPIQGGCSLKKPDCFIELYTHTIIVECDESQHRNYDTTCEETRINELYTDLGDRPIVFIRFNPDAYTQKGIKHQSSFKYLKKVEIPVLRDQKEWNIRLEELKKTIDENINNIPTKPITTCKLFYDD
jgi:hypothetical protein